MTMQMLDPATPVSTAPPRCWPTPPNPVASPCISMRHGRRSQACTAGTSSALAIKAAQAVVGDRPVRTVTTIFLRPAVVGPALITVEVAA